MLNNGVLFQKKKKRLRWSGGDEAGGEAGRRAGATEGRCAGHGHEGVCEHHAEQSCVHLHQDQREACQEGVQGGYPGCGQGA